MLETLTDQLNQGRALSAGQAASAVGQLVQPDVPAAAKADFLSALARKGETTEEIAAFARELRARGGGNAAGLRNPCPRDSRCLRHGRRTG